MLYDIYVCDSRLSPALIKDRLWKPAGSMIWILKTFKVHL